MGRWKWSCYKGLIKGRGEDVFREFRPLPHPVCESTLKFPSVSLFIDSQFGTQLEQDGMADKILLRSIG
jgi:hypothetical protein